MITIITLHFIWSL